MRDYIQLFGIFLIFTSCGSTLIDYDYDKSASFDSYKMYQFDFSETSGLSTFDEQRFVNYTDSLLTSRGLIRTDYNDMFIKIEAFENETRSRNTIGVGVSRGGGNVGVGVSGGIPIGGSEMHQQIIVTLYEARQGQKTIWEATSESDLKIKANPQKRDAYYKKLVEKIFSKYPPKN